MLTRKKRILLLGLSLAILLMTGSTALALKDSTLTIGSTGSEVKQLQTALNTLGYAAGKVDGIFGKATESAVRRFQSDHKLTADGLAGPQTLAAIYAAVSAMNNEPTAAPQATATPAPAATPQPTNNSGSLFGGDYSTISYGSSGERVRTLQNALNTLGYSCGKVDGKFGAGTQRAVVSLQMAYKLTADGKAGKKTLQKLEQAVSGTAAQPTAAPQPQATATPAPTASTNADGIPTRTLRRGSTGDDVKAMQTRLKALGYLSGSADGKFGQATENAVKAFQRAKGLTADGLAGKKTLTAIWNAASSTVSPTATPAPTATTAPTTSTVSNTTVNVSGVGKVRLLHWFDDIKPTLKNGDRLLIVEPSSGKCWTLRLYSAGRHADCEPLTAEDTAAMLEAFGGINTWTQKAVCVKLPNGTWTIGSTHDMPHLSGSVSDNNFNGHLCVHFFRTMSECEQNDPKYGVSNQETIRAYWKALTGETIK